MPKKSSGNKRNKQSNFAKLSIFQPNKYKFKKNCPLSIKGAPKIDYKNIKLLKNISPKMAKFYLQELQILVKKTKGIIFVNKKSKKSCFNIKLNESYITWKHKKNWSIGEVIDVKRGFARNYLISNKKALYASKENISQVEKIKSDLAKKDNDRKKEAKQTYEKINKKEYSVKKLSTENKELYGSVKPTEILN